MSKFVIVVFPDEMKAREGVVALGHLHREGNASIFGTAVVRRETDRRLVIAQPTDQGSLPLGVGALVKGLVELFETSAATSGPAPTGERWRDYLRTEMSDDSLAALARALQPGKFALITEVSADCAASVDARMRALGGSVMGIRREDSTADVISKELDSVTADVDAWRADHASIKARAMERDLAERIDEARAGLRQTAEVARLRQDRAEQEMNENLSALEQQATLATPDTRSRIEQRLGELRTDLGQRAEKLARAYELTREALHA